MKRIGITLLFGVGALVGLNGMAQAQEPADRDAVFEGINDQELFEAASPVTVSAEAMNTGLAVLTQSVTPLSEGAELEGPEGPEGPDADGPGGSTHEFEGEETGDH